MVMKYNVLIILFLLSNVAHFGCDKDEKVNNQPSFCKKIIINEDGDETEYEFDNQGRLQSLYGKSLTDYYKNPKEFKLQLNDSGTSITIEKDRGIWYQSLLNGGDGFKTKYLLFPTYKKTDIAISKTIEGLENNTIVTKSDEEYVYTQLNCTSLENGELFIDDEKVQVYSAKFTYMDKISPFANNPFQWLIEANWSAGGHTNENLTKSEIYDIESVNDPDRKVSIKRTVDYSYQFDSKGRPTKIVKNTKEVTSVTNLETGQTHTNTETKQSTISIQYNC